MTLTRHAPWYSCNYSIPEVTKPRCLDGQRVNSKKVLLITVVGWVAKMKIVWPIGMKWCVVHEIIENNEKVVKLKVA